MNTALEVVDNAQSFLFYSGIVVTLASIVAIAWNEVIQRNSAAGSADRHQGEQRQKIAITSTVIVWLLYGGTSIFPDPNFDVKHVIKRVEVPGPVQYKTKIKKYKVKVYEAQFKYERMYEYCRRAYKDSGVSIEGRDTICHNRALLLARPDLEIITQTQIKYKSPPYKRLFDNCIDKLNVSVSRNEVIVCHNAAVKSLGSSKDWVMKERR